MSSNSSTADSRDTSTNSPRRQWSRRRVDLDPAAVERLAREHQSQRAVAEALGVSQSTLVHRLLDTPELRRAYESGRSAREGARAARPLPEPEPDAAPGRARPRPEPAERHLEGKPEERVLAALAAGGRTFGELMRATGLDHHRVVVTVQGLMCAKRVVAAEVGGQRRHFLANASAGEEGARG